MQIPKSKSLSLLALALNFAGFDLPAQTVDWLFVSNSWFFSAFSVHRLSSVWTFSFGNANEFPICQMTTLFFALLYIIYVYARATVKR